MAVMTTRSIVNTWQLLTSVVTIDQLLIDVNYVSALTTDHH